MNRRGVGGGLLPEAIVQPANCKLWLDATDLATGTLTTWADKSGNGNDATAIASPTVDTTSFGGGKKSLLLNGTSQYVDTPVAVSNGTNVAHTLILVCNQLVADTTTRVFWDQSRTSSNVPWYNLAHGVGALVKYSVNAKGDAADTKLNNTGTGDTGAHVFVVSAASTTASLWRDGTLISAALDINTSAKTVNHTTLGAAKRGADAAAFFHNLAVAEVLAWNVDLSTADRQTEEARLKAKWGTP